ncbi:trehalase family glycosidase [candidate division KSB1 bacterium]
MRIKFLIFLLLFICCADNAYEIEEDIDQYREIKERLISGWSTWDSRSVLRQVLLPECFAINLAFKQQYWLDEKYLGSALIGRQGERIERIIPGPHTYNGSYTMLDIKWEQLNARIETAHDGDDVVVLITPFEDFASPVKLVIESAILWNRQGELSREENYLEAEMPGRTVKVYTTGRLIEDPYVDVTTPYLCTLINKSVGISTGKPRTVEEIDRIIQGRKLDLKIEAEQYEGLYDAFLAVQTGIAWNTVYEPRHNRVVSTVGRLWNEEYGGYCLFGWDNFFLAYMTSLSSRDLSYANVIEHLRGKTEEGFIPNDNRGNGSKSYDRSQPPVGGIMVREIYKRYPEKWFLETVFDDLLGWNRWWMRKRLNEGLLSYGSHPVKNPFREPAVGTKRTAGYESGMDDSPMYADVPFNTEKNTLELQDVGLNSLVIADCKALAEMAEILGREIEKTELLERAELLTGELEKLWDEKTGFYLNRRTDTGELSHRLSPTLFYPLLAGVPDEGRAERIVNDHFYNPTEFWGDYIIPTTARSDPMFERQRYWKGAIWPPTNFLTYLSLRKYNMEKAHHVLAEKSLDMFISEWERKGYVSENYSAITGRGDDPRLSSDRFHSWGALFGFMAFIERGYITPPEEKIIIEK